MPSVRQHAFPMFPYLLALFVLIPLAELTIFIGLGSRIGLLPTLIIILITGVLGAWLTKSQGVLAIRRFRTAIAEGRLPHAEVVDGLMILIAGALLLTPGFLTDSVGFAVLVPAVRARLRRSLVGWLKTRLIPVSIQPPRPQSQDPAAFGKGDGTVIDVEVMEETAEGDARAGKTPHS